MDWRVDVNIDGLVRSFAYPSEAVARKVLLQLSKSMQTGEGVVFAGDHLLNPRYIVSAQVLDYAAGGRSRQGRSERHAQLGASPSTASFMASPRRDLRQELVDLRRRLSGRVSRAGAAEQLHRIREGAARRTRRVCVQRRADDVRHAAYRTLA